jgi:hypothetical protein
MTATDKTTELYDVDFFCWTQEMARRLRERDTSALDWENLAEEIESMGKRDYRGLRSRVRVLLIHLLKWRYQDDKRSRSWLGTILEQRDQIRMIVVDSPSLRRRIDVDMQEVYMEAKRKAASETTIYLDKFPAECPWTFDCSMDETLEP